VKLRVPSVDRIRDILVFFLYGISYPLTNPVLSYVCHFSNLSCANIGSVFGVITHVGVNHVSNVSTQSSQVLQYLRLSMRAKTDKLLERHMVRAA
jgi:hypothetical protein